MEEKFKLNIHYTITFLDGDYKSHGLFENLREFWSTICGEYIKVEITRIDIVK